MPPPMSSSKKIGVRIALATGSTLATIIGAQSLAAQQRPADSPLPETIAVEPVLVQFNPTPVPTLVLLPPTAVPSLLPTSDVPHAMPSIVILRQSGQPQPVQSLDAQPSPMPQTAPVQANQVAAANPQILPPEPVVAAVPAPVVVQPDPIYVQPPPVVVQAPSSGGGGGGGGSSNRSNSSR